MRRKLPMAAKSFIQCIGHLASPRAMAQAIGVSPRTVKRYRRNIAQLNLDPWQRRFPVNDLREMYKTWCEDHIIIPIHRLQSTPGSAWTSWQTIYLLKEYGTRPLSDIAKELNRSRWSCYQQVRRNRGLSLNHHAWTVKQLADALRVPTLFIRNRIASGEVRWYVDERRVYIHRDDAERLLESRHARRFGKSQYRQESS